MNLGRYLCLLALAALLAPPPAFCAEGKTAWGARVSDNYNVWAWLSEYAGEDQESWDEQEREQQDAALAKAKAGCEKAGSRLAATRNQTDGMAILVLSENDLGQIGVCVKGGETIAPALEQKKARLASIRAKALKGQYLEADMLWMKENNITLPQEGPTAEERAAKEASIAKSQKQKYAAAKQKYGKLKGQDAKGLAQLYDGGKGSGAAGDPALAADLSGAKGKHLGLAKPELRKPTTKSLTAAAPPAMAGAAPKPAAPKPAVTAGKEPSYREGSASDPTIYFEDPAVKKAVAKVWAKAEEKLADPKYRSDTYTSNPIAKAVYNNLASTRVKTAMAANEIMMGYRYNGEDDVKAFQKDFGVKLTQSQIADIDHFYSGASYSAIPVVGAVGGVFFSVAYDGVFDIGKGWIKSGNGRVKYNVRQVGVDTQGCAFGMALTGTDIGEGTAKMLQ